jgi:Na+-driven multidrug efflux pump
MPLTIPLAALLIYSFRLSPEANRLTIMCLILIYAAGPPLLAGSLTIPAGLRAGGDAAYVSFTALTCMWCVRVTLSYFLAGVFGLGVFGINIAMVMDWIARNVMFRTRLKGAAWYSRRLIAEDLT